MHRSSNWERVTLNQVAEPRPDSFVDGPFGSNLKMNEYSDDGVRLIQLQNIGDGFWINDGSYTHLVKDELVRPLVILKDTPRR